MLEDDLRATLREHAAEPAMRPDLLDEVRGGIRRANRRRVAVLGAAALLVAAIAVPVAVTNGRASAPVPLQSAPADPIAGWERPRVEPPTFPLTPGWTPSGVGASRVGRAGPTLLLGYERGPTEHVEVEVGPEPGSWWAEGDGSDRATTVSGRPAKVRAVGADVYQGMNPGEDQYVGIRWQLADGRWVQVSSEGHSTESDVLRFARGLRLRTLPASPVPFTVAAAPAGLVLQTMTKDYLCLAPPALLADPDGGRGICVVVDAPAEHNRPAPEDERLIVGGRRATLSGNEDGPGSLTVPLDSRRVLTVYVKQEDVPVTREQLIRFAEGITVNG
ncbi:hypothetical protein DMB66_16435 [Actinoplanes sp. ATCC 53533]|nr:hypothetical protein DMB66_16435 [Actinoplanes sp. ATCC 53533]